MTLYLSLARRGFLAGSLVFGLSAFRQQDGDLGPDHADDPRWAAFRGVKTTIDLSKGAARAIFPPDLLRANNQIMDIGGYIIPLESKTDTSHFILTRRSSGCPFCPPNEANEAVEVFMKGTVAYESKQFLVRGRLKLVSTSDKGLFFQLHEATAS